MTRLRRLVATVAATALASGALIALSAGAAGALPLTKVAPADNLIDGKPLKVITQPFTYAPFSGPITVTQCSADLPLAPGFGTPAAAPSANCHADNSIGAFGVLTGQPLQMQFADDKGKLTCAGLPCVLPGGAQQGQLNHEFSGTAGSGGPCTGGTICLGALQGFTGATNAAADCSPPLGRVMYHPSTNPLGAIPPTDSDMNGLITFGEYGQNGPDSCTIAVTNLGGGFGPGGLPNEFESNNIKYKPTAAGATAKLQLSAPGASSIILALDGEYDGTTAVDGSLQVDTPVATLEGETSRFASNDAVNIQFLNKSDNLCRVSVGTQITPSGEISVLLNLPAYRAAAQGEAGPHVVPIDVDGDDTNVIQGVLCNTQGQKVQVIGRGQPDAAIGTSGGISHINKAIKMVSKAEKLI